MERKLLEIESENLPKINGLVFDCEQTSDIANYLYDSRFTIGLNEAYSCEFLSADNIIYIEGDEDYNEIFVRKFKPIKL